MSEKITRRDFLKVAGMGSVASVLLSGCKEAAHRRLMAEMGKNPIEEKQGCFTTTCGECPAGCGLLVHTAKGRIQRLDGNPAHPVNHGNICGKGLAALERWYSPNRIRGPLQQAERGSGSFSPMNWRTASSVIGDALSKYAPGEIAFLLGLFPDHLNDLVQLLSKALGGIRVLRWNSSGEMEGCVTLMDATQNLFGAWKIPHFDLEHAEVIYSFGANFSETWLPPAIRWKHPKRHVRLVHFGARRPDTVGSRVEWLPIRPGSEAILAQALACLVSKYTSGAEFPAFATVDLDHAAETSESSVGEMKRLARLFAQASRKAAIPGSISLGNTNGLAAAKAILALNVAAKNLGKEGGMFLPPDSPIHPELTSRSSTIAEVAALIENMKKGQVKVLLVHGINPVYDLPRSFGFQEALRNVELVISFTSFYNETAMQADYLLPDHTPLEGWGYQRVCPGGDRMIISGMQPVVSPLFDTHSTADLLLKAAHGMDSELAASIPFANDVDFLQKSLAPLMNREGSYTATSPDLFWALWLKNGGWWETTPSWMPPVVCASFDQSRNSLEAASKEDLSYYLLPIFHSDFTRRERTDHLTSHEKSGICTQEKSNTWVELHVDTARALGLRDDDMAKISSPVGEIQAKVRKVTTIRPDTIAISIGGDNSAFSSNREDQRENPLDLLGKEQNESGGLAFAAKKVGVSK
jgi:anaerobic selenocysteine-containing dehydrogenase